MTFFKQYSWLFDIIVILICSFFLARIAGVFAGKQLEVERSMAILKPTPLIEESRRTQDIEAYKVITARNIFDSSESAVEQREEKGGEVVVTGEAVETALDVKVIGVLVVGEGKDSRSSATVMASGKGEPKVYAVGDKESFAPETRLTRVQPDRIEFTNGGRLEFAKVVSQFGELSIFGPPKRVAGTGAPPGERVVASKEATGVAAEGQRRFSVDQSEVENALQNLDKLYTEIRAVPHFTGGKVEGMKILSVKNDSIFGKLGIKRGDVLQKINGMELDVKRGFEIFSKLKDSKSLTVDLVRDGKPTTFEYEIR